MNSPSSASNSTATTLIAGLKAQDPAAWESAVRIYGPLVYHWCRRMGLDAHDAADVLQDVFARLSRAISSFDVDRTRGTFRGWLWTITRHKVLDWHRQTRRDLQGEGGSEAALRWAELADPFTDSSTNALDRRECTAVVRRALDQIRGDFQTRTWQAFWQSTVEQRSTDQVAGELRMSAAAVRQAKSRVLRRLRETLGE